MVAAILEFRTDFVSDDDESGLDVVGKSVRDNFEENFVYCFKFDASLKIEDGITKLKAYLAKLVNTLNTSSHYQ